MTQKPKLEPGDRVRVYGPVNVLGQPQPVPPYFSHARTAYVLGVFPHDSGCITEVRVKLDDGTCGMVSERQCRKLRPKQKPEKERADSAAVGSIAGFAFSMDPSIPPNEVHMRHNGKTVAVFTCGELPGKDKA